MHIIRCCNMILNAINEQFVPFTRLVRAAWYQSQESASHIKKSKQVQIKTRLDLATQQSQLASSSPIDGAF